ncbi:hypothetical protein, partial [Dietzia sp. DQ11-44]
RSAQAEPRVVGVERTTRPVGVHDGAAGRRSGVRNGDDVGTARPVGVYENTVGAVVRAVLRSWDTGFLLVVEENDRRQVATGGADEPCWRCGAEATTAHPGRWRGPRGVCAVWRWGGRS